MQIFIWSSLPPPPLQSSGRLASSWGFEGGCSSDGYRRAGRHCSPIHTSIQWCQLKPPFGHAAKHGSQCCGWQIPILPPELPASLVFSDHFNMMMSSLASRKGTNVPVLISAVSTARTRCVRLGRHLGVVSKPCARHTRAMHTKK